MINAIISLFTGRNKSRDFRPIDFSNEQELLARGFIYRPLFAVHYDGEKTPGEIGDAVKYFPNYRILRTRSWQSFMESDITQLVIKKYLRWVIGTGLKLKAEPMENIIPNVNIPTTFRTQVEGRFRLYSRLRASTYDRTMNLHQMAKEVLKNALIGGDVLIIIRIEDGMVNAQAIDGEHVVTPPTFQASKGDGVIRTKNGNRIVHGVEVDDKGRHVAYHVRISAKEFERVEAVDDRGRMRAFLVYGLRYRLDNHRGVPLIVAVLEKLKKMDRYHEAVVGSAEERAKLAYAIEHKTGSTGENPFIKNMASALNLGASLSQQSDDYKVDTPNKIMKTTGKQVVNLPLEATIKTLESTAEMNFPEFWKTNFIPLCATMDMPPEVALAKYDSNFSSSRAALKDWEHTLLVSREDITEQFYEPFYKIFLEVEVLSGRIFAPRYLQIKRSRDIITVAAYEHIRMLGVRVPHIDPLKEAQAERLKLGKEGSHLPLTTAEQATENLSTGDFEANAEQFNNEIEMVERTQPEPVNSNSNNRDDDNSER